VAYSTDFGESPAATAKFLIKLPADAPKFSVKGAKYPKAVSVTITDATKDAVIYYTTNGKTPTTAAKRYTKPVEISSDVTLKAIAVAPGGSYGPVTSAIYIIETATPVIKPDGGSIASGGSVTITDATAGAAIYYTTDDATPSAKSKRYSGPIKIKAAETIKAMAIASGHAESGVVSAHFTIKK
jgi:hypothetical protein